MKLKAAFVCIHNSCRSQMAEAIAREMASDILEVYSAGTQEYPEVKPMALAVLKEDGLDTSMLHPKLLKDIPNSLDILITMGCGVECPFVPTRYRADWGLDDPSGGPIEGFRETRDLIKQKMAELVDQINADTLWKN